MDCIKNYTGLRLQCTYLQGKLKEDVQIQICEQTQPSGDSDEIVQFEPDQFVFDQFSMNYPKKKKKKEPIAGLKETLATQEAMGFNCIFASEKTDNNGNTKEKEPVEVVNRRIIELLKTEPSTLEITKVELQNTKAKYKELNMLLKDGSEAYRNGQNSVAAIKYKAALDMIADKTLKISDMEENIIRYMLYMAWLESRQLNDLMEAVQHLIALEKNCSKTFPAVYYALSKAQKKMHRFTLAYEMIEKGFACLDEEVELKEYYMPGTNIILSESTKEGLSAALNAMKDDCTSWHLPDAVCCKIDCLDNSQHYAPSREIFFSDPAFNGMVIITCNNIRHPCVMKYHQNCWKLMKDELSFVQKMSDKDTLGVKCFTPNCQNDEHVPSLICKVEVIGEDAQVKAHIEAPTDPVVWAKRPAPPKGAIPKQPTKPKRHVDRIRKPAPTPTNVTPAHLPNSKEAICDEEIEKEWRLAKLVELREINFGIEPDNDWRPDKAMYGNAQMINVAEFLPNPEFPTDTAENAHVKSFIFSLFYDYIKSNGQVKIKEVDKKWREEKYMYVTDGSTLNITDISEFLLQTDKITMIGDYLCIPQCLPEAYSSVKDEITDCVIYSLKNSLNFDEAEIQYEELTKKILAGNYETNEEKTSGCEETENEEEKVPSKAGDLIKWVILPQTFACVTKLNDDAEGNNGNVQKTTTGTEFESNLTFQENECRFSFDSEEQESDVITQNQQLSVNAHSQTPEIPITENLAFNSTSTLKPEPNDNHNSEERKSSNRIYLNVGNAPHIEMYMKPSSQGTMLSSVRRFANTPHARDVVNSDLLPREAEIPKSPNLLIEDSVEIKHTDKEATNKKSLCHNPDFKNKSQSPTEKTNRDLLRQGLDVTAPYWNSPHTGESKSNDETPSQELSDMRSHVPELISETVPVQSNFSSNCYSNIFQNEISNHEAYWKNSEETDFDINARVKESDANPTNGAVVDPSLWYDPYSQELEGSFNMSQAEPTSSYFLEQESNQTTNFQESSTCDEKHGFNSFLSKPVLHNTPQREDTIDYSIPEERDFNIKNQISSLDHSSDTDHKSKITIEKEAHVDMPFFNKKTESSAVNEVLDEQQNSFKPLRRPLALQKPAANFASSDEHIEQNADKKLSRKKKDSVSQDGGILLPAETLFKLQASLEHDRLKAREDVNTLQEKLKHLKKDSADKLSTLRNDFSNLKEQNSELLTEKARIEQLYEALKRDCQTMKNENSRLKLEKSEVERNLELLYTEKNIMENLFEKDKDKLDKKLQKCHSRLKDKATEIETLQSKLIELEDSKKTLNKSYDRNSCKERLHYEFVANETVLNATIQKCHENISVLNEISRLMTINSAIPFHIGTALTNWQQTLTHLHEISTQHKVQYSKLCSLLEKDDEHENMEEIRLVLPETPSPPPSNIMEVLQAAFANMYQNFRVQFHKSTAMQHRFPPPAMGPYPPYTPFFMGHRPPHPNQQARFNNMQNANFQSGFGNNQSNVHENTPPPPHSNLNKNNSQEMPPQNNNINQLSPKAYPHHINNENIDKLQLIQTNGNSTSDLQQSNIFIQDKNAGNTTDLTNRTNGKINPEAVIRTEDMGIRNQKNGNQQANIVQPNNNNQTPLPIAHNDNINVNMIRTETPTGREKKQKQKTKNIDGVMQLLRKKFVGVLECDLLESLNDVRRMNNNSLTGMRVADIISQAETFIVKRQEKQLCHYSKPMEMPAPERSFGQTNLYNAQQTTSTYSEQSKPPTNEYQIPQNQGRVVRNSFSEAYITSEMPQLPTPRKAAWATVKSGLPDWKKEREDPECCICWDPMLQNAGALPIYTLKCQHSFHNKCIRKWLETNRACPKCRVHCTMDDEFPPLPS